MDADDESFGLKHVLYMDHGRQRNIPAAHLFESAIIMIFEGLSLKSVGREPCARAIPVRGVLKKSQY
jgi:hypothetical protein